ncbi:hypothetical protein Hanom_Chr14g01307811 [Helianthus anomalus]
MITTLQHRLQPSSREGHINIYFIYYRKRKRETQKLHGECVKEEMCEAGIIP